MISLGTMVKQIDGLLGTSDLNEWETEFVESVVEKSNEGAQTNALSAKQAEIVERIWRKHFAA